MTIVYLYGMVALTLAGAFALLRVEQGPGNLDRVVALDIVTAVLVGGVALISAAYERTDLVPVLVVLSLVGFVGSVSVARFAAVESTEQALILTEEELQAALAAERELDDGAAPVHDPDAEEDGDRDDGRPRAEETGR